ncbi:hypothetical protein JAAARDRAFT_524726 [Jaapia argillacea MUCL 33604]|uniref:Uncharacterized protein n=1 Tax=Jaapia argillacea MUCL 33604 TaxID=933084 RepID=A0A067QEB7_9AGAM|nr:hypothetical protein JAAARDRAFT_524726 [Jaapia argillacea MUCL 33604]
MQCRRQSCHRDEMIFGVVQGVKHLYTNDPLLVHRCLKFGSSRAWVVFASLGIPNQSSQKSAVCVDEWHPSSLSSTRMTISKLPLRRPSPICRLLHALSLRFQIRHYSFQIVPLMVKGALHYTPATFVDAADAGGIIQESERGPLAGPSAVLGGRSSSWTPPYSVRSFPPGHIQVT